MRIVVLLLLLASPACLSLNDSDCLGDSPEMLRDPRTGACIEVGSSDACRYCSSTHSCLVTDVHALDFAACGAVASASEAACIDLPGHLAVYAGGNFLACWTTAPSGPIHDGGCIARTAYECVRHDNCAAFYRQIPDGTLSFDHCADEVRVDP